MNNLANTIPLKKYITRVILLIFMSCQFGLFAQVTPDDSVKRYTIGEIIVSGNTSFSSQTVVTYSGLKKGDQVAIPGDKISAAIKKLWGSNLFSSINIYITKIEGDTADLEIELIDLPELNEVKIEGIKKKKVDDVIKENSLQPGVKVTENLITTTKNYLENSHRKKGFLNSNVTISTVEVVDSLKKKRVNMFINIDKGNKIKVKDISFEGSEQVKAKKLRKSMKNTKKKNPIRVFKIHRG